jgi:hypothetical protein
MNCDPAVKVAADWINLCLDDEWGIDPHWRAAWCRQVRAAMKGK